MSGASRATKRKHVLREMWEDDYSPPTAEQKIVKVLFNKGNNLHQVETPEGEVFLASMPNKFRRNVWIRRGQYVVIDPIKEGHKVKGEIVKILTRDHIKIYNNDKIWPNAFSDALQNPNAYESDRIVITNSDVDTDSESGSKSEESDSDGESDSQSEPEENNSADEHSESAVTNIIVNDTGESEKSKSSP